MVQKHNEMAWCFSSATTFKAQVGGVGIRCIKREGVVAERVRVTLSHLGNKKLSGEPITLVTAYDYPSATHVDASGIDICLVGDSASMCVHGHSTTLPITLDEMLIHCRAVARGAKHPLLIGDLPFGTYESSPIKAVETASRIAKEGGMDGVKLEGGIKERVKAVEAIVGAGIAVMGHVGLTPQAIGALGGFRAQGRSVASAMKVVENALALEEAGCFCVVLECVPPAVAAAATAALTIPTLGVGAGPFCSGQALVYNDIVGMLGGNTMKFCKKFGNVGEEIISSLVKYKEEVVDGSFPSHTFTPYTIKRAELEGFIAELTRLGLIAAATEAASASHKFQTLCSAPPPSPKPLLSSPPSLP